MIRRLSGRFDAGSLLPMAFAALTLLLLLASAGSLVRLLYPVLAVAIGFHLVATSTKAYLRFVLWLWVLSPLVRRMADFDAGWQDPSLVLVTPYLVSLAGCAHVAARLLLFPAAVRAQLPEAWTMFVLAALATAVGIPAGFALHNPGATLETLNWLVPVGFGAYLASCRDEVVDLEQTVVGVFMQMAVVVGLYGAYQFFKLPLWDAYWMLNSGMSSIGFAEAFAVRVFSTLHSPGVLGYFIMAPLVFWLARPNIGGLLPVCLAAVALLLSQVRTAWLGFAIAAILVLPTLRLVSGARVALYALLGVLSVTPFLQLPEVSDRVNARLETIKDLPSYDQSAVSRLDGHYRVVDFVTRHPFGVGIGASPAEIERTVGMRDSILVAGLVQFGFLGMALHLLSLAGMAVVLCRYYRRAPSREGVGLACAGLGMLATVALGIPNAGPPGMVLWMIGGVAAARVGQLAAAPARVPAAVPGTLDFAPRFPGAMGAES